MNKKEFYKAQGKLEGGKTLTLEEQINLMAFADMLVGQIEDYYDEGDEFGTEGWEHWIGGES